MITFTATGRHATARTDEAITTGSVGIPVEVALNADFDGLQAILVFACGDVSVDVALLGQDVTVPPQLVTERGKLLTMGVYATRPDGTIVIPTVWAEVGIVREGTQPSGVDPAEPTPSWAAQVQQWASDAAESAETATETAESIREDMDEFNESSAIVLADARTATTAANGAATNANTAASAANTSATAADAATASAVTATGAANDAASAANDAAALATSAAGVATDAAGNADIATAAARAATTNANQATSNANQATQAATQATEQADQATTNANQAAQSATTATTNANSAMESASAAASAANAAAVTASQEAEGASAAAELANAATTAATNATQAATTATTAATQAASTANDAAERAEDAIEAIGDISELAVPLMSADVRGGAKLGEGLAVVDGALTISADANESDGAVRGSIASLTAKGWAEQTVTDDPPSPSPDYPAEIRVARGRNLLPDDGWTTGVRIKSDGTMAVSSSHMYSKLIPVTVGNTHVLHGNSYIVAAGQTTKEVHGYDSSGTWVQQLSSTPISGVASDVGKYKEYVSTPFVIPEGVSFVRVSMYIRDTQVQLELGSNPTPYVPYGHVGVEAQSKNLLSDVASDWVSSPISGASRKTLFIPVENGESYHYNRVGAGALGLIAGWADENKSNYVNIITLSNYYSYTFANTGGHAYLVLSHGSTWDYATVFKQREAIIERGDAFTGYAPYFHHTIPVPLPSKGYVAALPDGTADTLTIDGAGKWEWTNRTAEVDLGTLTWTYYGNNKYFATVPGCVSPMAASQKLSTHYVGGGVVNISVDAGTLSEDAVYSRSGTQAVIIKDTSYTSIAEFVPHISGRNLLYALITSAITTESGYTEAPMPSILSEATITCPELDALGVTYLIGDDVRAMAEQWYARARSEYEDRLAALEQAVSEIIAG